MGKPKIRFKGYEDAWEQRKLDGWGTFYYGRSCPKWSVTEDATIPCIRYGELYTKFGAKIDRVYSYTNMPPENLRFSKGTEVLIPRVGEDPMDYNHCTWLSMPDVAIGEMISVFNTDNNPLFTATMFNATLQNEFAMRVEGGSVTNLYFEKLKNIEVSFPSIQEQEKIAAYFENLDHLITLHQRKCEETKSLKKYMLQKMFPENGKCVPEIRFSGFSDAWEQRKFGEIVEKYEDLVETPTEGYTRLGIRSHAKGTFHSFVEKGKELETAKMFRVAADKFIVNITFGWEHAVAITDENDAGKLVSHRFPQYSFNAGMVPKFFRYLILDENFKHHLELSSPGGAGRNRVLKLNDMLEYKMNFPSEVEQGKIAAYFDHLDHLITLHQRKCEETKSLKKYMLQKMFPENGKCVPEIRFSGFSDAWEQRKFGEIVEKYEDLVETPTEGYTRLGIRSHAKGTFHSFVEKGKELETAKMFRVAADKFIVNITFGWEHAVAITDENDAGKLVSHRFPQYSFNAGMVPKFFRYLILDENFKHHLELSSPGGAGRNRVLKLNDMLEYKMNFPSEVEQGKIAAYFDHLDHLITLHQHKCDELQKLKKFMLQNMFV